MLTKVNIAAFSTPSRRVDLSDAMHSSPPGRPPADVHGSLSVQQLAHELNSLLDGSLRCVRQAEDALDGSRLIGEPALDGALRRLRTAQQAMIDMARMLSRAMTDPAPAVDHLRTDRTVGCELEQLAEAVAPLAEQNGIVLTVEVQPEARDLPAGPLGPVLMNGIRNSIEACQEQDPTSRRIDVSAAIDHRASRLVIAVSDTGCGLDAPREGRRPGHGLGLSVCREVIADLGGELELLSVPCGPGTIMRVRIPLDRLRDG